MTTHGLQNSPEYRAWRRMKTACYNEKSNQYATYGGKGIRISAEWVNNFIKFYEDLGPMPPGCNGLELLDKTKDFSKYNCKWTRKTQGRQAAPKELKKTRATPYKRVANPKTVCLIIEKDLLEYIKKQAWRKSLDEGYQVTSNDLIRDALTRQFPRNKQTELFR